MLGGEVQANSRAAVGEWALAQIEQVTLDSVFLSVDGINRRHGLTTHNPAEASVKRALMRAARTRIVMADRTKLRREEFARVAPLEDVDMIITDARADADYLAQLEACGPKVIAANL
jgi:DeoR family fructose operon transcriptional repressor